MIFSEEKIIFRERYDFSGDDKIEWRFKLKTSFKFTSQEKVM